MTQPPERLRRSRYRVFDGFMGTDFGRDLGQWVYANRMSMRVGGDGDGRYNREILDADDACPLLPAFKARLLDVVPEALGACEVEAFDLARVETHVTLHHHGSFFDWHDDSYGPPPDFVPVVSRAVTFCYYLHSNPRMFTGGELEFADGALVDPKNDSLVVFDPHQRHRVRRVECWSSEVLHGRWAVMGWVHKAQPKCESCNLVMDWPGAHRHTLCRFCIDG